MKRGRSRAALWPRSVRLDVSPEPVKHGEDGGVHRVFVIALGPLVPDDLDSRLSVNEQKTKRKQFRDTKDLLTLARRTARDTRLTLVVAGLMLLILIAIVARLFVEQGTP